MSHPSAVELEVRRIRELVEQRRFAEASKAADALLVAVPENRDVLYLRAHAQRLRGDIPAALATLAGLERLHPRFSRLYQERGHCYVALKQASEAIDAFLRGVNMNPALPASWSMLEGLYRMTGEAANAAVAAAHVATLKKLPAEVVTATTLFSDGELAQAEQLIRAFLIKHGHHVEAMRLLARIGLERDVLDDSQLLLEAVLDLASYYHQPRYEFPGVFIKRPLYNGRGEKAEKLLAADRLDRNYRTLSLVGELGLSMHERAIEIYRELLVGATQPADLHFSIAHSLKTLGRRDEAIAEYHATAASRTGYGDTWL